MLNVALQPALLLALPSTQAAAAQTSSPGIMGAALGLVLGIVQLIVGLSIAAFAINQGFKLVSKMLEGIHIWGEVKNKNMAVALLAAGVVLAYTNVIAGGITSMTGGLRGIVGGNMSDGISALIGGALSLIVAISVASFAITVTFTIMDKLTTDIDEKEEFRNNNVAIGIVYAGIMIGVSGLISAGVSGIGSSVTELFKSIL